MKINPHCVVGLSWTLKDTLGDILDELDEPVEFLLGGDDLLANWLFKWSRKKHLATTTKTWCF